MKRQLIRVGLALLSALGLALVSALPPAQAATIKYEWVYDKNPNDHTNGTLSLYEVQVDTGKTFSIWSARAGSGQGVNAYNACVQNQGWLPNGVYSVTGVYANYPGTSVTGPAVELSNKQCSNGTWRTALFIHSSYPWATSHFNSDGCIKVSNTGGPANATGVVETMYNKTKQYNVQSVVVETA